MKNIMRYVPAGFVLAGSAITATAAAAIPTEIQAGYDDFVLVKGLIFPALVTIAVAFIGLRWLRKLGSGR